MEYATLFEDEPSVAEPKTIEERFAQFHKEHPEVYEALVRLAYEWVSVGRTKLGIKTLYERLRWEWHVKGLRDSEGYKLNNDFTALYARKIMAENIELDGLFETRERATELHHRKEQR